MKSTVLTKVLVLFLVLEMLLAVFSYVSMTTMNKNLEQEVISSLEADTERFAQSVESGLKSTYEFNSSLSNQANINRVAIYPEGMSSYDKAQTLNALIDQLDNLVSTNSYLYSASVYFTRSMRVYHTASNLPSYSAFTQAHWEQLSEMADGSTLVHRYYHPIFQEERCVMLLAPRFSSNRYFLIELVLDENYFTELAQQQVQAHNGQYRLTIADTVVASNLSGEAARILEQRQLAGITDRRVTIEKQDYWLFQHGIPNCAGSYLQLIPSSQLLGALEISSRFSTYFFIVLIASIVAFFIATYQLIHKPLTKLTDAFQALETGNFNYRITGTSETEFSYLYREFNRMSDRLQLLILQDYESKLLIQKAEMKQLQTQINPHFLYNSFFLAQTMLKTGMIEESQKMLELLGISFRYVTKTGVDYVSLEEEYNQMQAYTQIQSLRFQGRVQMELEEIPEGCRELLVPKMILQPILENAFHHGMRDKPSNGRIRVGFHQEENRLRICIEDNNEGLSQQTLLALQQTLKSVATGEYAHEMTGLLNIHRRLIIYSKASGRLEVSRSALGGLQVDVLLDIPQEQ